MKSEKDYPPQAYLIFHNSDIEVTVNIPERSVTTWMDYFNNLFVPVLRAGLGADMNRLSEYIYDEYAPQYEPETEVPDLQDSDTTQPDTTAPIKSAEANYKAWITTPTVNPYDIPQKEK